MTRRYATMALAALMVLTMTACGSGGGLGDIFGGGGQTGGQTNELRGRVDYVDTSNRYVVLTNVSGYGNMLSGSSGQTLRVHFEDRTPVEYQGRAYKVTDLERGDEVAVQFDQSGNNVVARSMTVLYDSRSAGANYPGGTTNPQGGAYENTMRGTVRHVDLSRRTIEIDRGGYGGVQVLEFDNNTYVTASGRNYSPQDLQRGDEVEVRVRDMGNGRFLAQDVNVIRSVGSGSGSGSGAYGTAQATIRGTVRYVDTTRREIGLDQTSWISRFTTGGGSSAGGTLIVRYDTNTNVEFGGQLYPPTNLERGDIIDVQVQETGSSTYLANRILVVRDVNTR